MQAMRAKGFNGYDDLELIDLPKPKVSDGRVLVRMTAAGVTPLDHTILSGQYHGAKAPLVLGNEGAGVVEEGGGPEFPAGSRVMFTGPYGVLEDGTYCEWLAVRKQDLCLIPDGVEDVRAAGIPVAYLTAQMTLSLAGFEPGKTVLAPAIGGSVGNAVTQVARASGAKHAISSTTSHAKALEAKALGFNEVIDGSSETLSGGVRRITGGNGVDIVIDAIGGDVFSEALTTLKEPISGARIGRLDRADGPALILHDPATGAVTGEEWWKGGKLDRADGPAVIVRDAATGKVTSEEWWKDGQQIAPPSATKPAQAPQL